MNLYRVDKREHAVVIYFSDGVVSHGVVFLGPNAYGEQTVLGLLREREPFLPFRDQAGRFTLISKSAITHLGYQAPAEGEVAAIGQPIKVQIVFFGGEILEGAMTLEMPEEKNRLLDFINASPGFFLLRNEESCYVANSALVREIAPC